MEEGETDETGSSTNRYYLAPANARTAALDPDFASGCYDDARERMLRADLLRRREEGSVDLEVKGKGTGKGTTKGMVKGESDSSDDATYFGKGNKGSVATGKACGKQAYSKQGQAHGEQGKAHGKQGSLGEFRWALIWSRQGKGKSDNGSFRYGYTMSP